jgi:hypothetical protein
MANNATSKTINAALLKRFGAEFEIDPELAGLNELEKNSRPSFASTILAPPDSARFASSPLRMRPLCPVEKRSPTMRYHHRQRRHDTKVHRVFYPGDAVDR